MDENEISGQIRKWLSSMQDLSNSAFQSDDLEELFDEEVWISDHFNNHVESSIQSGKVDGILLRKEDLRHNFKTEGEGELTFTNGDYFKGDFLGCLANRSGVLTRLSQGDAFTFGTWRNGKLEGSADLEISEGGWRRSFYEKGVLHGLSRTFQGKYGLSPDRTLLKIAFYKNNRIYGTVWKGLQGGAFLVGPVDEDTEEFSGRNIYYLYPDLKSAICGRFENGRLIEGRMCQICGLKFDEKTKILQLLSTTTSTTLNKNDQKFKRDFSTNYVISRTPLLPDPWESSRVEVRRSSLDADNAGEGLYAKIPIYSGQIIAMFNGIRLLAARNNSLDFEEDIAFEYRIRLNADTDLDIPKNCRSLSNYCATLGHKVNHSFQPNAKWSRLEHPRFGLICSVVAIRDICPNEEIFVNYGIKMSDAPNWYKALWVEFLRKEKCMTDEQIKDWCGRQYAMNGKLIQLPI